MRQRARFPRWLFGLAMAGTLAAFAGCATMAPAPGTSPDYFQTSAVSSYRPVAVPGTQRRVAQTEAEELARRQILEFVGSMPAGPNMTVNELMARNSHVRSRILGAVRTAELVDWHVVPECGTVQVDMRIDLNRIRAIVSGCY